MEPVVELWLTTGPWQSYPLLVYRSFSFLLLI
jgi:hypothetical protein